jgi:hypothetical protein
MEHYSSDYPLHVKYLLEELCEDQDPLIILPKYISTLPTDPTLFNVFKHLGYCESTSTFLQVPELSSTISAIKQAYAKPDSETFDLISDSWDVSRGIKDEYLKIYYDSKLQDLSEAFELGLNPFESEDAPLNDLWTTPKKASESFSTEECTPRHCRGLKFLTTKVKQIIYSKGFFSYKEVSDELVKELEISEGLDREKEEKNILRRVYDALNVLIASGVVVKRGKKYVWQRPTTSHDESVRKEIKKQRKNIREKKEALKVVVDKYIALNQLLQRNKAFPFLIIATEEHPDNAVSMKSNSSRTELSVKFKKEIKLYGEIDILPQLSLGKNRNVMLPEEIVSLMKNG